MRPNEALFCVAFSLTLCLCIGGEKTGRLRCGNMDPAACKEEFTVQLNFLLQKFTMEMMGKEIADIIAVFEKVVKEMPPNDPNAKLFKTAIDDLKSDTAKLDPYSDDYENLRNVIREIEINIQPHTMKVSLDNEKLCEIEKLLEKHNYTTVMQKFNYDDFTDGLGSMWSTLYENLRTIDFKTYPDYEEINKLLAVIKLERREERKTKLLRDAMKMIRKFISLPLFEKIIFYNRKINEQ